MNNEEELARATLSENCFYWIGMFIFSGIVWVTVVSAIVIAIYLITGAKW